jgi:aspartokinase
LHRIVSNELTDIPQISDESEREEDEIWAFGERESVAIIRFTMYVRECDLFMTL